jgi:Tfp pilus assembly protein PilX
MSVLKRSPAPSRPAPQPAPRRLARRLADESGIALVMALAVMLVLTVLVSSAVAYSSSDSRDASRSNASQKAYADAEAGLNDALAYVQTIGGASDKMYVSPTPASVKSGCATASTPTCGVTGTASSGTYAAWGGSFNGTTQVWTLTSIGTVSNPTGSGGSAVVRTLTQTATITPPPYSFVSLQHDATCPTTGANHTLLIESSGQLTVTNAMYIDSCNNPNDAFDIFGAGGNLSDPAGITVVGGWEAHDGSTVAVKGTTCALSNSQTNYTGPQPAGCPTTGQPYLADPLASKLSTTPPLGATGMCLGTSTTTAAYNPAVTENGALTAAATSLPIKWGGGPAQATIDPVAVGDTLLIDSEQMLVTARGIAAGSAATLTVTRAQGGTTAAAHANNAAISKVTTAASGTAANPAPCVYTAGTVTLQPGTYYGGICIGSSSSTSCAAGNCTASVPAAAYSPAVTLNLTGGPPAPTLNATSTSVPIKWTSGSDPVTNGDTIKIDSEDMLVTAVTAVTSTTATLTVTRATQSTTAAVHNNNAQVKKVTLPTPVNATLAPGIYIMAGGGFRVCGSSTLSAPNVLIYNTNDPSLTTGNGALDQIELDTTGSVSLGPQTSGSYDGLTIWQDKNLALAGGQSCDSRNNVTTPNQNQINTYDIALLSAAPTSDNSAIGTTGYTQSGSLGSIRGSIYAPANNADFVDALSGTANLAVLTSCILVNGGTSTFAFDPTGLFGTTWALGPQAG